MLRGPGPYGPGPLSIPTGISLEIRQFVCGQRETARSTNGKATMLRAAQSRVMRGADYALFRGGNPGFAAELPLPDSHRAFRCARCWSAVSICRSCDRGNRYCSRACAGASRQESLLSAGRRYQESPVGRASHARRQAAYRQRRRNCVTHHGSPKSASCAPLRRWRPQRATFEGRPLRGYRQRCCICGARGSDFIRFGFIHETGGVP